MRRVHRAEIGQLTRLGIARTAPTQARDNPRKRPLATATRLSPLDDSFMGLEGLMALPFPHEPGSVVRGVLAGEERERMRKRVGDGLSHLGDAARAARKVDDQG